MSCDDSLSAGVVTFVGRTKFNVYCAAVRDLHMVWTLHHAIADAGVLSEPYKAQWSLYVPPV